MAPAGSESLSIRGDGLTAEGDSKASSSIRGTGKAPEEGSESSSISGDERNAEDRGLTACSAPKSKRVRQAVSETSSSGTELDVGMWSMLDDHLLEKIFSRLPFKSLFQVSSLSRTWRLRFLSPSFQNEVHGSSSASSSWNSYAPLFVNHKKDLVGYESGSKEWHRLPTHSYLQRDVGQYWWLRAGAGSLLCWVCPNATDWDAFHIHVTNPLTRSWKQLPRRPKMHFPEIVHVGLEGRSKAYKVIVGKLKNRTTLNGRACIRVQIFDSTDDSWTMESYKTRTNCALGWGGSTFINGVLSVLLYTLERSAGYILISFDVKEKIWKEIPYLCLVVDEDQKPHQLLKFSEVKFSQVFVNGTNVMLVVVHIDKVSNVDFDPDDSNDDAEGFDKIISVFRLDLERGLAFEVSRAPDKMLSAVDTSLSSIAGQDNCIYIGGDYPHSLWIRYNVGTREWSWVDSPENGPLSFSGTPIFWWRWTSVAYQPGLNPFLEL